MKITADTNVLLRAIVEDDERQAKVAQAELAKAETIAVTLPALCELAWVLSRGYRHAPYEIADAIQRMIDADNVAVNRPAATAGLAHLADGGDFADGVIAYEGSRLSGEIFLSFDQQATKFIKRHGGTARLL